ncbi:MAG: glycosyltransferase family 39 protein [Patescibacteria group bacterium]|nr:glycosyltransferase family 39 protein [Patescibacteria group bacterium]
MQLNFSPKKIPVLFILILAAAFAIRMIYPNLFITDGDTAGHILASLRLFHTSLLKFHPPIGNFFFQIFQFRHGFTVILLPFFFYFIFFKLLGLAISEPLLVFICAIWGVTSIAAVYLFVKKLLGEKSALLSALLIAFLPVHIGLSRLHTGPQIISIIFLYLSLYLLLKTIEQPAAKNKILYFLSLAFYIGADNAFMVGLFFNLAVLAASSADWKTFFSNAKKIYLNWLSLIFLLPIIIYAAAAIISLKFGINSGYLLRLFEKFAGQSGSDYKSFSPDIVRLISVFLTQGGAIFLGLLAALFALKSKINRKTLLIALIFLSYFLIFLVSGSWQDAYIVYALVPACILISLLWSEGKKTLLIYFLVLVNLFYSLGVLYNLNIFLKPIAIYGSINREIKNNDTGGKSLAYLVRENKLEASRIIIPGKGGMQKEKIGILANDDSIWYYSAAEGEGDLNALLNSGRLSNYDRFLAAVSDIANSEANDSIKKFVADNSYGLVAEIYDRENGKKLMSIYSNYRAGAVARYYADILNPLYDKKYENIDGLSNVYSGMF